MQKIRKFRLVQRLIPVENRTENLASLRFGQVLLMDYMGAVEYERGAFSDFLVRMQALNSPVDQRSFWQRRVLRQPAPVSLLQFMRATVHGVKIFIAYDTTRHTATEVIEEITAIAKGRANLKMPARFPSTEYDRSSRDCPTAWAEIKENVIWSLSDLSHLGDWLNNTVTFLAQEKQRIAHQA